MRLWWEDVASDPKRFDEGQVAAMIGVVLSLFWWWLIVSLAVSLGLIAFVLFVVAVERWRGEPMDWLAREQEMLR